MGFETNIGKYQIGRLIGEGAFAKVKLATDTVTGRQVAIKMINKEAVMKDNLVHQVQKEIKTMKLLHHPNIVRIHEVIGTKTKIYIVMEYVSGGQLSEKLSYIKRFSEEEARKLFHQLIDAVDYCHGKGVYHRDLKPENLLLDSNGTLKISDFGLSAMRKPGDMLSTACGSPCYVAPELILNKSYNGAAADIWSCGVILFELLAGKLPFDDRNLMYLYTKICRAEYRFPGWFTEGQKKLISRIFDPNPKSRIIIAEIIEDAWFQTNYKPACGIKYHENINLDDIHAAFGSIEEKDGETKKSKSSSFINAFQLISMSHDLDLSGLFNEHDEVEQRKMLGSQNTTTETIKKIEAAAKEASFLVERMNNLKLRIHPKQKMKRCCKSFFDVSAEVIEVAPKHCVVEISKSAGELGIYKEFCNSLSSVLEEKSTFPSQRQEQNEVSIKSKDTASSGRKGQ